MRPIGYSDRKVQDEIDFWIYTYNFEKLEKYIKSNVYDRIDPWDELMRTSKILKQKYPFLNNFMKDNRINVVEEKEFSDEILNNSWRITFYEDDSSGTVYFVLQNNWEIIKVPYEQIAETWDIEVSGNWTELAKLWDYVDDNTTYILQHDYSWYWNDQSPLYVIPYIK